MAEIVPVGSHSSTSALVLTERLPGGEAPWGNGNINVGVFRIA